MYSIEPAASGYPTVVYMWVSNINIFCTSFMGLSGFIKTALCFIIGVSMAAMRRRNPPKTDAIVHAAKGLDKTAGLEVKYIDSFKGRGVFAKAQFQKADFVVEYRGELINSEESQRRRRIYHGQCTVFMFDFLWQERTWCIDAAREDGSLGRLVNDDHIHPNCKMKKVITEGKPHLCLFALRDIKSGEEITYDYGGTDWPWRKQVGGQSAVTESSQAEPSITTEQDPQSSSFFQNKVGGQSAVTESSQADPAITTEQDPQSSSFFQKQEQDPQSSSFFQNKVGGQSAVTESSQAEPIHNHRAGSAEFFILPEQGQFPPTRLTSRIRRVLHSYQNKVGGQSAVTESSQADPSITTEQDPQSSSFFQNKVGGQSAVTESSQADPSITTEQDPQSSSFFQNKVGGQSAVTESSQADPSITTEQDPQSSSFFPNKVDSYQSFLLLVTVLKPTLKPQPSCWGDVSLRPRQNQAPGPLPRGPGPGIESRTTHREGPLRTHAPRTKGPGIESMAPHGRPFYPHPPSLRLTAARKPPMMSDPGHLGGISQPSPASWLVIVQPVRGRVRRTPPAVTAAASAARMLGPVTSDEGPGHKHNGRPPRCAEGPGLSGRAHGSGSAWLWIRTALDPHGSGSRGHARTSAHLDG
ncbi:unnamed protein product [Boreogadus saida]